MSYQRTFTNLLGDASYQHEQHLYEIHDLIVEMIKELVPPMMEQYWKEHIEQYWKEHMEQFTVDVITLLNGKQTDLTGLRADLQRLILEELKKCSITARK